jgi:hypothetical protein|uniref:Uncharacterized protein n=1 Tax=viral metagenome TaxID=1070528 RepID=A0A6C0LY74_9ZZZZ
MAKGKLGKKVRKGIKKFAKSSILKSSVTLYIVLLVAISLVLLYLSKKDYNSLIVLIATGYLTNHFNKNMTITLGVAILASLLVRVKVSRREGFEEKDPDTMKGSIKEEAGNGTDPNLPTEKCWKAEANGSWSELTDVNKDDCLVEGKPGRCWNKDSTKCKQGFSKRLIPSSEPAKVGNDDDDEVDTTRIDYAKTLEQAYDNLQGMLGKDGIKGLTSETTKLVQQQQGLMESLKGMGPMMKEAKSMMAGMKDMGSLENMKDMKAIVNTMAAKK